MLLRHNMHPGRTTIPAGVYIYKETHTYIRVFITFIEQNIDHDDSDMASVVTPQI